VTGEKHTIHPNQIYAVDKAGEGFKVHEFFSKNWRILPPFINEPHEFVVDTKILGSFLLILDTHFILFI
jgi:hypothetical protein